MSNALTRWNRLPVVEAENEILACCGSRTWAHKLVSRRPFVSEAELLATADEAWRSLTHQEWTEAFRSHPRIGESDVRQPPRAANMAERSVRWSANEQSGVATAGDAVRLALADANREYEERFGRIFIVCATGKSAAEILTILRQRLQNDEGAELREAVEQQRQITQIRLKKWLGE